jgi:hypothetical protein
MQFENSQELPINDSMRDDMLFKVSRSDHQGRIRRSSFMKVVSTYGIFHTSLESVLMACSKDVYRQRKALKSLKDANHHHMEDIMGYSALMQRFDRVDFIGQPCMKTQKISSGDVEHVRSMEI